MIEMIVLGNSDNWLEVSNTISAIHYFLNLSLAAEKFMFRDTLHFENYFKLFDSDTSAFTEYIIFVVLCTILSCNTREFFPVLHDVHVS